MDVDKWQSDLASGIATALADFRHEIDVEMEIFAVDCHPWSGMIVLAFLTQLELRDTSFLSEADEMAAWKYYDFGATLASWQPASGIGSQMRTLYEEAGAKKDRVAKVFFQRCAAAVASKQVQDILLTFRLVKDFKITIPHPDTGEEFYPR